MRHLYNILHKYQGRIYSPARLLILLFAFIIPTCITQSGFSANCVQTRQQNWDLYQIELTNAGYTKTKWMEFCRNPDSAEAKKADTALRNIRKTKQSQASNSAAPAKNVSRAQPSKNKNQKSSEDTEKDLDGWIGEASETVHEKLPNAKSEKISPEDVAQTKGNSDCEVGKLRSDGRAKIAELEKKIRNDKSHIVNTYTFPDDNNIYYLDTKQCKKGQTIKQCNAATYEFEVQVYADQEYNDKYCGGKPSNFSHKININKNTSTSTSNSNDYTRIENEKVDVKDPEFCARTVMCITTNLWQNKTPNCSGATDDWMKKAKGINVSQYKQSNQSDEYNKNDYQVAAISQICGSDIANNYKMEKKEKSSNLSSKCEEFCVPDNDEKIVDDWHKCSEEAHKKYGEGKDALYKYQQYRKTTACDKEKYQDELRKDAQKIVDAYNKKLEELKKASESQPAAE